MKINSNKIWNMLKKADSKWHFIKYDSERKSHVFTEGHFLFEIWDEGDGSDYEYYNPFTGNETEVSNWLTIHAGRFFDTGNEQTLTPCVNFYKAKTGVKVDTKKLYKFDSEVSLVFNKDFIDYALDVLGNDGKWSYSKFNDNEIYTVIYRTEKGQCVIYPIKYSDSDLESKFMLVDSEVELKSKLKDKKTVFLVDGAYRLFEKRESALDFINNSENRESLSVKELVLE